MSGELTELQKKHRKEMQEKRDALNKRKARTHRLIVRGAIAEAAINNAEQMTDEEFQDALLRGLGKKVDALKEPSENPSGERASLP